MNAATVSSNVQVSTENIIGTKGTPRNTSKQTVDLIALLELVGNTDQKRNWRGILIALLVIVTVLGLIVAAIVLVTPKKDAEVTGEQVKFTDFVNGVYKPRTFQVRWQSGNTFIYRNAEGEVMLFNCSNNSSLSIMDNSTFRELDTGQYKISADGMYALLPYNIQHVYSYTFTAKYKIYNTITKTHVDLLGPLTDEHSQDFTFQYLTWSSHGHNLVAVQNNNMYLITDIENNSFQQITFNGAFNQIHNGVPDWLYEEEILHSDNAIWWCPDNSCILYASFNDTGVRKYDMSIYGPLTDQYIENRRISYPKPGTPNPTVHLYIYNIESNTTTDLQPPAPFLDRDYYFTTITWMNDTHVIITWLNRPQNISIISICDVKTSICAENLKTEAENGWIDIGKGSILNGDQDSYFLILPRKDGEHGNFKHIAMVEASKNIKNKNSGRKVFLTSGRMDVRQIVGFDAKKHLVYFTAIKQGDPREKHLFSTVISLDDLNFRQTTCISCNISTECLYVEAEFSQTGEYYIRNCRGPGVPTYHLIKTPNTFVKEMEGNTRLRSKIVATALPTVEYVQIPIENNKYIWSKVVLPPTLKKEEIITYNLLVKVYNAPNTQQVTHEFRLDWEHYLCSVHSLVIVYVDGRGSSGRGDNWLYANYKHLSTLEMTDIISAGKYFKSLPYINERTAIIGKSHGGHVTTAVLGSSDNIYNCGIAVSPVTDWRYYDSFYTERYMGLPYENVDGYHQANVSRKAHNFKRSRFLLIHGTGDDKVHFQNSAQLMKALTAERVYFRSQFYTDQKNNIRGETTTIHYYYAMEDFLFSCLGKQSSRTEKNAAFYVEKDAEEVEE